MGNSLWISFRLVSADTRAAGATSKEVLQLEGSVIAPVKASQLDKMVSEFTFTFKAVAGRQAPEAFEGAAKDTLTTTFVSGIEKRSEPSGLTTTLTNTNEEPLEIKAKV